jgi:hypothetical protein
MLFSPFQFAGKNADKPQCGRQSPVPLILQMHRIAHFQSAAAYGRAIKGHVGWLDLRKKMAPGQGAILFWSSSRPSNGAA